MAQTQVRTVRPLVSQLSRCYAWVDQPIDIATVRYILGVAAFTAVYFLTAHWGLSLSPVSGFATFVWPPTGISLAVLLIAGPKYWPGIFVGAFWVNLVTGAAAPVALVIAVGNTLGPATAAYLLRQYGFDKRLQKVRDVVLLVGFAALFSTLISATIGTTSLLIGGNIQLDAYYFTWLTWWIGDMLGILVVAPLLLVWSSPLREKLTSRRVVEAFALGAIFITIGIVIFDAIPESDPVLAGAPYLLFSFLIWAALRFNIRYITALIFLLSAMAIWSAKYGHGPFYSNSLHTSLFATQLFMGAIAVTFLIFSGVIAERYYAKVAVQQLNEELQKSLSATTEKLHQEREIEKLREEFVATASHELKTPVTSIKAYAQILLKDLDGRTNAKSIKLARNINSHADILTGRVNELLDASKMSDGNISLKKSIFDINALLERIVSDVTLAASGRSIRITGHADQPVFADKQRVEQAVINVLSNAIKFSPANSPIRITVSSGRQALLIAVTDKGPGIAKKDQSKIFRRFYRTEDTSLAKHSVSGMGLGLYIASEIIRRHDGRLWVDSKPGKGSTFYISLPTYA